MKNLKRIALFVIVLTLVCQVAFAYTNISGAWVGTVNILNYKSPKIYGVVDGAEKGTMRFVIPNIGSGHAIKGQFQWAADLTKKEKLYVQVTLLGKTGTIFFEDEDILLNKKGTKLVISGTLPDIGVAALKNEPFLLSLVSQEPAVKKIATGKAKVGVSSLITVKTTDVTDYVVMTDATGKIIAIDDTVTAKLAGFNYAGWTKGKNTLYFYAGLKDGMGNLKIKSKVGEILTANDKLELSFAKKIVKKAA